MAGKRTGRHPTNELTPLKIKRLKEPGDYADGNALYLRVDENGAKRWIMRLVIQGRRRYPGLGSAQLVELEEARDIARQFRKIARAGGDPLADRRKALPVPNFETVARQLYENKRPEWKNAKHSHQWISSLEEYAFRRLGRLPINSIGTDEILKVLEPIWTAKPETASRVRQRIESVLDFATVLNHRCGPNPSRWDGHLEHLLAKPSKVRVVRNFSALPWSELPSFMTQLTARKGAAARALAFTILSAARTSEVLLMTWSEINFRDGIWSIPGSRMKAGKPHDVPLTRQMLELIGTPGKPDELVFKNSAGKGLSESALRGTLRRMKRTDITTHGFRATFKTWAGEATAYPRDVIEYALAHGLKNKSEAAYDRGTLFPKRVHLMADWSNYACGSSGTVTVLRPRAGVK